MFFSIEGVASLLYKIKDYYLVKIYVKVIVRYTIKGFQDDVKCQDNYNDTLTVRVALLGQKLEGKS